jgi:outer membrane protein, heavy metal efflux system
MPDVPSAAARLTGINNAIVFHESPDSMDATAGPTDSLSPQQAIRLALSRDPRIQLALAKVRIAEADANQARLLPNPILTIDLRYPLTDSNTAFEPSLTADLLSLLQKPAAINAADHRLREAAENALVVVLDVMSEVQEAYAATRSVDAEIDNATRRHERLAKLRDIAQKRLQAGEGTRLDVLTLDAQLMQSTLEVSDFQVQRVTERMTLARLVGQPRSAADWQLSAWQAPPDGALAPEADWVNAAMQNRPEIQAKIWELRALGEELSAVSFPPLQGGEMGVHAEHDPEWRIGPVATIPLPLFDFGQAARAKIKAERSAARYDLAEQQLEVIENVRVAYATYVHARAALDDAQNKLLPLTRQQVDQAQLAYSSGEADLATLLLAQNDFELTLAKIVELQEKLTVARVKLQPAAGGAGVADRLATPATQPAEGTMPLATQPIGATTAPASQPTTGPAQ